MHAKPKMERNIDPTMYDTKRIITAGTSGYWTSGTASLITMNVKKQDAPIMVPLPSIIIIHVTISTAPNLVICLVMRQNDYHADVQKAFEVRATWMNAFLVTHLT